MKQKRILFLGAANHQLSPILYAKETGYEILTLDNKKENPGHKLASKSFIVDTLDIEKVLKIAIKYRVDGVMSYASDVSAYTRSYICHKLGLPGFENDLEGIKILTNKSNFRKFLKSKGMQEIFFETYNKEQFHQAMDEIIKSKKELIVKPVDGSGSRGVAKITRNTSLVNVVREAYSNSPCGNIIIEDFIDRFGKQICGDGIMIGGELCFILFGDGLLTNNLVPYAELFPSSHDKDVLKEVKDQLEQILKSLGFRRGVFNFDVFIKADGSVFVNEIGPRSGGNYIPEAIFLNTGVHMVEAAVESTIDKDYQWEFVSAPFVNGYYACYVLHSEESGILSKIEIDSSVRSNIYDMKEFLKPGALVEQFSSGNKAIGHVILRFDSLSEMQKTMENIRELIFLVIK